MRCVEKVGERSERPSLWSEGLCSKELKKDGSQNRPLSVSKNGNPRLPLMRGLSAVRNEPQTGGENCKAGKKHYNRLFSDGFLSLRHLR